MDSQSEKTTGGHEAGAEKVVTKRVRNRRLQLPCRCGGVVTTARTQRRAANQTN